MTIFSPRFFIALRSFIDTLRSIFTPPPEMRSLLDLYLPEEAVHRFHKAPRVVPLNRMTGPLHLRQAAVRKAAHELAGVFIEEDLASHAPHDQRWACDLVYMRPQLLGGRPQGLTRLYEPQETHIGLPHPSPVRQRSKVVEEATAQQPAVSMRVEREGVVYE